MSRLKKMDDSFVGVIQRWWRDLFPPDSGYGNWGCRAALHDHRCKDTAEHGYQHLCECGFRWAS